MSERHHTRPGADEKNTPLPERPPTMAEVQLEIINRCAKCQQQGGPMHTLIEKVDQIAADVRTAATVMTLRRGREQVWKLLGGLAWGAAIVVLGWYLTVGADRRTDAMLKKQAAIAVEVAKQLQTAQTETRKELDKIKSATVPWELQK